MAIDIPVPESSTRPGQVPAATGRKEASGDATRPADLVLQGGGDCLRTLLDNADRYYLTPDQVASTIFVDHGGVSSTDFHLTADQ